MMLHAFFEKELNSVSESGENVRKCLNPVIESSIPNGQGVLTEWFDGDKRSQLENFFEELVEKKFSRSDVEKTTEREKSTRITRVQE